jgi:hypothetical protein
MHKCWYLFIVRKEYRMWISRFSGMWHCKVWYMGPRIWSSYLHTTQHIFMWFITFLPNVISNLWTSCNTCRKQTKYWTLIWKRIYKVKVIRYGDGFSYCCQGATHKNYLWEFLSVGKRQFQQNTIFLYNH